MFEACGLKEGKTMSTKTYLVLYCKTPDCLSQFVVGEEPVSSDRSIRFSVPVQNWEKTLRCPVCGKEYRYTDSDVERAKLDHDPDPTTFLF